MNSIRNVRIFQGLYISLIIFICIFYTVSSNAQQPEINDQYENSTNIESIKVPKITKEIVPTHMTVEDNEVLPNLTETKRSTVIVVPVEESFFTKIRNVICKPIARIMAVPKINTVIRNVGTCIVNGAMDLITYYFPPPLIPLIATAAGMIIPFEPVVMLRQKMPVTSYRRALKSALDGFMGTFDRYKFREAEEDDENDPYMTRRFNRRLMNDSGEKNKVKS